MGCDYYHITFLKIYFKDGSCEKFIELDREREWFIEVEGQNDMTEEEYDECQEKYGVVCQEPIIIYNNDDFLNNDIKLYYSDYLKGIDLKNVEIIKKIENNLDRI